MEENVTILFNSEDIFSSVSEAPYITKSSIPLRDNHDIGLIDRFSLDGTILPGSSGLIDQSEIPEGFLGASSCGGEECYQQITNKQFQLLNSLTGQIGSFQIKYGSTSIYSGSVAKIESISFGENNYSSMLHYTINVKVYDEDCWKETFGVESVQDQAEYVDLGCDFELRRTISAKGFQTSSSTNNSFTNARDWVQARTGETPCPPVFIASGENLILKEQTESANRFAGTYELNQSYIYNTGTNNTQNILKNQFDYESGESSSTISIQGIIEGGLNTNFEDLRDRFHGLDLYDLCNDHFQRYETGSLNTGAIEFSVTEDPKKQILEFSAAYDNNESSDPYLVDSFDYSEDFSNGRKCVTFNGEIRSNVGCQEFRNTKILDFYSGFDFDGHIRSKWVEYGFSGQLDPQPQANDFFYDEFNSIINTSYTYCEVQRDLPDCISNLDYSISFKPPLVRYSLEPSCTQSGVYIVQNLGYNGRGVFNIQGNARIDDCCSNSGAVNSLLNFINIEQSTYISGNNKVITEQNIDWNNTDKNINFSYSWSYNGNDVFTDFFATGLQNAID